MFLQKIKWSLWVSFAVSIVSNVSALSESLNANDDAHAPLLVAQQSSKSDSLFSNGISGNSGSLFDKNESSTGTDRFAIPPPSPAYSSSSSSSTSDSSSNSGSAPATNSTSPATTGGASNPGSSGSSSTQAPTSSQPDSGSSSNAGSNPSVSTDTAGSQTNPSIAPTKSADLTPLLPQQFNAYQLLERAEPIQQQSIRTNGDLSGFDLNAQTAPRTNAIAPGVNTDTQADQTGAQAINSVNQMLTAPGAPANETAPNGERTGFKLPAAPEETASGTLHKEPVEEEGKTFPEKDVQAEVEKSQIHESAGSSSRGTGLPSDQNKNSPIAEALDAMHSGQYTTAATKLNAIVAKNQHDAQAHYLLAVSYVFLNRIADASYEYEAAAKYAPPGSGLKERVAEGLKRIGAVNSMK